jgi:hypothetical protein
MDPKGVVEIRARFTNTAGCGHLILPGDVIAFNMIDKRTRCAECWRKVKIRKALESDRAYMEEMKID